MIHQGKIVLIEKPTYKPKIENLELGPEAQAALDADLVKKYSKLKVHGVGEEVEFVKKGDHVYITPRQLSFCNIGVFEGTECWIAREQDIVSKY